MKLRAGTGRWRLTIASWKQEGEEEGQGGKEEKRKSARRPSPPWCKLDRCHPRYTPWGPLTPRECLGAKPLRQAWSRPLPPTSPRPPFGQRRGDESGRGGRGRGRDVEEGGGRGMEGERGEEKRGGSINQPQSQNWLKKNQKKNEYQIPEALQIEG